MKVKKLRKILKKLPKNMEIIIQKDSEGNGYSPLYGADSNAVYIPDTDYSGEVYDLDWSAEDADMSKKKWKKVKKNKKALILFPRN